MRKGLCLVLVCLVVAAGCSSPGLSAPRTTTPTETDTIEPTTTVSTSTSPTRTTTSQEPEVHDYENLSNTSQANFLDILQNDSVRTEEKLFDGLLDSNHDVRIRYEGTVYVVHEEYQQSRREVCYSGWSAVNESYVAEYYGTRSLNESYLNFSELNTERERDAFIVPFENSDKIQCYLNGDPLRLDFVKYNGTYYQPSQRQTSTVVYKYVLRE